MAHLNVKINDIVLKNPVMTASGTFGYGLEFADFINLNDLGGIIVKGTTLHPREGNDYPRMAEPAMGLLNCVEPLRQLCHELGSVVERRLLSEEKLLQCFIFCHSFNLSLSLSRPRESCCFTASCEVSVIAAISLTL